MNKFGAFKTTLEYFKLCSKFSKSFLELSKELDNESTIKFLELCKTRIYTIITKKRRIK